MTVLRVLLTVSPAGENGYLRCLNPRAGKQFWKKLVDGTGTGTLLFLDRSESSPAVVNNEAYVATYDGILYSFTATTGALRWKA